MLNSKTKKIKIALTIIILALVICSYIVFNIIDVLRYRGGRLDEIIYKNDIKSDINYTVYLKPNNFIDKSYITNEYSFISSLVEYIKTTYSYEYVGNSNVPVDYDYYVKATIVSKYIADNTNLSKPLWNKDFILLDHKRGHAPTSNISITEELNIGLDYYNELLETFRQTLNIALDSRLDISLIINIKGSTKNNVPISKNHYLTMSIPLGVRAFDINVTSNFPKQETLYNREQRNLETSYMLAIMYIIIIIIIIGITLYFSKRILRKEENEYDAKVNKILSEYDDRVVSVSNFIRYEQLGIIDIIDFKELLTISDETLEPIIFWEKKNKKNMEAWFSVIRDKVLYRYVIVCKKE